MQVRHSTNRGHSQTNPPPFIGIDRVIIVEFDILIQRSHDLLPSDVALDSAIASGFGTSGSRGCWGWIQCLGREHLRGLVGKEHRIHWCAIESIQIESHDVVERIGHNFVPLQGARNLDGSL